MTSSGNKIFWYSMSALLAVALLWFAFRGVDWRKFWSALSSCKWGWVVLSMGVSGLVCLLRGWRWRMLLRPIDRSTKIITCFNAVNISYIANMVVPRIGEFVRCGYVTRRSAYEESGSRKAATYDKVLGTVVVERGFDASMLVVLLFGIMVALWPRYGQFFSDNMLLPMSDNVSLNLILFLLGVVLCLGVVVWSLRALREKSKLCLKIWTFLVGIWHGITQSFKMKSWPKFLLATLLIWLCYWVTSYCIILAVQGIDQAFLPPGIADKLARLDMVDAIFLMFVGSLSSLVPVPGGFGAFHYMIGLALMTMYGIPMEVGVIFATLSHESMAVSEIIFGAFSYVYETVKR